MYMCYVLVLVGFVVILFVLVEMLLLMDFYFDVL